VTDDEETEWRMTVPFVVTVSNGGTLDDTAFVAGFHASQINAALCSQDCMELEESVLQCLLPLLDLFAMKYGYVMHTSPHKPEDTYVDVVFEWVGIGEVL
jgi:hypothetical protein